VETVNLILGIVASAFSITAAVVALKNRKDLKLISAVITNNRNEVKGNSNTQVIGSGNQVN